MKKELGIPALPPGEIVWVSHYDKEHNLRYIITSKPARDSYTLYELKNGEFVRWGRGRDPQNLADRYDKELHALEPELEDGEELEL